MSVGEFNLIDRYFKGPSATIERRSATDLPYALSIGDDAAVLTPTENYTVAAMDTLIAGIHFPHDTTARDIAYKSLMVNLSDIAAMGATPNWYLLSLTLPDHDHAWLTDFSQQLTELNAAHQLHLIGGDTCRGTSLSITISATGTLLAAPLTRGGAQPGDLLYVTNATGLAAAGLATLQGHISINNQALKNHCLDRLNRPLARINEGAALARHASACIDISDGLAQDLHHVLTASNDDSHLSLGADIDPEALLQQANMTALLTHGFSEEQCLQWALYGGDDYELLFTLPTAQKSACLSALQALNCSPMAIGAINNTGQLTLAGHPIHSDAYQHF